MQTPNSRSDAAAKQKLIDLYAAITAHDIPMELTNGLSLSTADQIKIAELTLAKATDEYLNLTAKEELLEIVRAICSAYVAQFASPDSAQILITRGDETDALLPTGVVLTAIDDRPFVIATISTLIQSLGLNITTLFHPIIRLHPPRAISLGYIQIERTLEKAEQKELEKKLKASLLDLIEITNKFSEMTSQVSAVTTALSSLQQLPPPRNEAALCLSRNVGECVDFLSWLVKAGYVFLGYRRWNVIETENKRTRLELDPSGDLGLFSSKDVGLQAELDKLVTDAEQLFFSDSLLQFSKLPIPSPVYRANLLDLVTVKTPATEHSPAKVHGFIGLLSSKAQAAEADTLPIIKNKLKEILDVEEVEPQSYSFKEMVYLLNSMPKAELLLLPTEILRQRSHQVLGIQGNRTTRLSINTDPQRRLLIVMLVMPAERFSDGVREQVQSFFENYLGRSSVYSEKRLAVSGTRLARLHIAFECSDPKLLDQALSEAALIESQLANITFAWPDKLRIELARCAENWNTNDQIRLSKGYEKFFPDSYRARTNPHEAALDIGILEKLSPQDQLAITLNQNTQTSGLNYDLKVYKFGSPLSLSLLVPILENCGFEVLSETTTDVVKDSQTALAIYHLQMTPVVAELLNTDHIANALLPLLRLVINGEAVNDKLNCLAASLGLTSKEICLLRTVRQYLHQIRFLGSIVAYATTLQNNREQARLLLSYFAAKFNPDLGIDLEDRRSKLVEIETGFLLSLKGVKRLSEDGFLRAILNVFQSTCRTNFYRNDGDLRLALKIECSRISRMPEPRPLFEIFVHSPDFEGVHLRSARVARGGLRWSERPDDFRIEVLGLMKTQVVKNSIIVPAGAKGGFVLGEKLSLSPNQSVVERCYKDFIRSLLELTDNLDSDGAILSPCRVVKHDIDDPYLVVAADKGTATFSDIANEIAVKEFQFWLGDAFASGGSLGYDHKKLGITAKGAWECVLRHFRELGVNAETDPISVVGIGDMSGDVFGNGLILSENFRLIGAFNHRHIFLDPSPHLQASYEERTRLFRLPRSSWGDYRSEIISQGGGVFERSAKEIQISPEAQKALGIQAEVLSGNDLIKAILRAPVDLLWNGGIGTYVKATDEDHFAAGDSTNDDVRVDASELRARVVGEGGNLGFTQRARIEFATLGGRNNTDSIDNSGGVDLSDLEVNLKILLDRARAKDRLSLEDRNRLLLGYAQGAAAKILKRNRGQGLAISLDQARSLRETESFSRFIRFLEKAGLINPRVDALPDHQTLIQRSSKQQGLLRPELSLLISHAKLQVFDHLDGTDFNNAVVWSELLQAYFPEHIGQKFSSDVLGHPLHRDIIAAQVANLLVETMGATFVHRLAGITAKPEADIISAFLAAYRVLRTDGIRELFVKLDTASSAVVFRNAHLTLSDALEATTLWILQHAKWPTKGISLAETHVEAVQEILAYLPDLLPSSELEEFTQSRTRLESQGVESDTARRLVALHYINQVLDIAQAVETDHLTPWDGSSLYFEFWRELDISRIIAGSRTLARQSTWDGLAIDDLLNRLRQSLVALTTQAATCKGADLGMKRATLLEEKAAELNSLRYLANAMPRDTFSISMLYLLAGKVAQLAAIVYPE